MASSYRRFELPGVDCIFQQLSCGTSSKQGARLVPSLIPSRYLKVFWDERRLRITLACLNLIPNLLSSQKTLKQRLGTSLTGGVLRSLYVSWKLPTYPSPKPTLTLTSHLGQNVGLKEGRVGGWAVSQERIVIHLIVYGNQKQVSPSTARSSWERANSRK